jgi:hypothetical protein
MLKTMLVMTSCKERGLGASLVHDTDINKTRIITSMPAC